MTSNDRHDGGDGAAMVKCRCLYRSECPLHWPPSTSVDEMLALLDRHFPEAGDAPTTAAVADLVALWGRHLATPQPTPSAATQMPSKALLCGARGGLPGDTCQRATGHAGDHTHWHPTSGGSSSWPNRPCGAYLGDNDATCPQLTCIRPKGHKGLHDNVLDDGPPAPSAAAQMPGADAERFADGLLGNLLAAQRAAPSAAPRRMCEGLRAERARLDNFRNRMQKAEAAIGRIRQIINWTLITSDHRERQVHEIIDVLAALAAKGEE